MNSSQPPIPRNAAGQSIRVWLLAERETETDRQIEDVLSRHQVSWCRFTNFGSLQNAADKSADPPPLVVVVEDFAEQFSKTAVTRGLSMWPLARWIVGCSDWCESAARSGRVWPPAVTVPARRFEARLYAELQVLQGLRSPLPLTASAEEAVLFDVPLSHPHERQGVEHFGIHTPDNVIFDWLHNFLTAEIPQARVSRLRALTDSSSLSAAISSAETCPANIDGEDCDLDAIIIDTDPHPRAVVESLVAEQAEPVARTRILLTTMPDPQLVRRCRAAGLTVVPKLHGCQQLLWALQAVQPLRN